MLELGGSVARADGPTLAAGVSVPAEIALAFP